jgi:hypothetical protein
MLSNILAAVSQRDFLTREQLTELVTRTVGQPDRARAARLSDGGYTVDLSKLRALMLHSTPKQQTWLIADQRRVYVVLDDRRKEEPLIMASLPLGLARPVSVNLGDSEANGSVHLGSLGSDLQYSKILFQRADVRTVIEQFLDEVDA